MPSHLLKRNAPLPSQVANLKCVASGAEHIVTARAKFPDDRFEKRNVRGIIEINPDFGVHLLAVHVGNGTGGTDAANIRAHVSRDFTGRGVPVLALVLGPDVFEKFLV